MDGNHPGSALKHYEVKNMREKEPASSLNGDVDLASAYVRNGYPADNDGSGSESGYTTPKKRRARRSGSSTKGAENAGWEKEKAVKPYSKQETETSIQETSGKAPHLHSRLNCTRACLKPEMVHTGVRRTGVQDTNPVAEVQHRNSDGKISASLSGKKTEDRVNKNKPASSVSSKEDSWTLFKPPPVFPVDNSSAKIVPKISYASKVKENLNKASVDTLQTAGKLSHVPMSAVKTVTSSSFADIPLASLDANGCYPAETSGVNVPPSVSSDRAEEDAESAPDNACGSPSCLSAPEPRKSSLFVYPHKPLNMQPPAAQTNQKSLGNIFHNQWGLSFINEPNAGPAGAPVSRLAAPFEISDITFQGENVPFVIQPSPNAVSLPTPRRSNGTGIGVSAKPCSASHTASQDRPKAQPAHQEECEVEFRGDSEASYEDLCAAAMRNSLLNNSALGLSKTRPVKEQGGAHRWGWADLQAAVFYHTKEFEYLLNLHKQHPDRVTYYAEVMDGPDH